MIIKRSPKPTMAKKKTEKCARICFLSFFIIFTCAIDLCFAKAFKTNHKSKESEKKEAPKDNKIEEPIVVNGDVVEYSTDNKEITASGNVMVNYKGTKLTCKKLTVNTLSKDALAEGNVRIEDNKGLIEGEKIAYNFASKTGTIFNADFRSSPMFGRSRQIERVSESEFTVVDGYATTCSYDRPHFRLGSKKINFYPHDKIQTKDDVFYIKNAPFMYLPRFNASLKDRNSHVQISPGKSGAWGPYVLTTYRCDFSDDFKGKIYTDYRMKLGPAGGFGANYSTPQFGKGHFKYYYAHEKPEHPVENQSTEFQRYFVRLRHNWEIDDRTKANLEFYKIKDSRRALGTDVNFLKDYFFREYEKDSQPPTYLTVNHAFDYSSLNLLAQKEVNHWYTHTDKVPDEKLPQVTYDLPEYKLGETPFYFKNTTEAARLVNNNVANAGIDNQVSRFDTYNQFSSPFKASIFWFNPFVGTRETAYSMD
ncbi:MAG: LPS assembly protein LptD, partial [Candidatus Omnitrophica bacterium]|nr:LPS assembly protein LptD [Candidatus Omnitrophota bacterium]